MSRLSKETWLNHGLKRLAEDGFTVLKADKLVKELGVSRGSFYWHFKNLADFHSALLNHWRDEQVNQTIAMLESQPVEPIEKIRQLVQGGTLSDRRLEKAIRAWSLNNEAIKLMLTEIDQSALGYLEACLRDVGLSAETARDRARIIYSGFVGKLFIGETWPNDELLKLIEEIVSLSAA